jgi:hypothetical protein
MKMATKKSKTTVTTTVEDTGTTLLVQETVPVVMGNSPTTNARPIQAAVNRELPQDVIRVPLKLEDVQYQVGMFQDLPRGRYVMSYEDGFTVQVLSVYWDGVDTVSV